MVGDAFLDIAKHHTADPAAQSELVATVRLHLADDDYLSYDLKLIDALSAMVGKLLHLEHVGAAADATPGALKSLSEWRGRPCLVQASIYTPGWTSEGEKAEHAAFREVRQRFDAHALPCLTFVCVYDESPAEPIFAELALRGEELPLWIDRASFEHSMLRDALGISQAGVHLLIDAEGVVRAWSFHVGELTSQIEKLLKPAAPSKKRRVV
ncbi:MAG: hypothetical protein EXS13_06075 [Planctomycetes bacterium]|nr:hypothetical protein [Planctomycetota bacterium]